MILNRVKNSIILLFSVFYFLSSAFIVFAATVSVSITSQGNFSPADITIDAGDTVQWTNNKDSSVRVASDQHSASEAIQHLNYLDPKCPASGCWDSTVASGGVYSFNFKIPGTWDYHDHLQPGKKGTVTVRENSPPGTVNNLQASDETLNSISLTWTASGDDAGNTGNFGTSTSYDIRYNTETIIESNWANATQITGEPAPKIAGTTEGMTVTGLQENTLYYFAIKASDEAQNISSLSNVVSLKTLKFGAVGGGGGSFKPIVDSTPPGVITDLKINKFYENALEITWTASGDDEYSFASVASFYEIKIATSAISDDNWVQYQEVIHSKNPQIAGFKEKLLISNLEASTTYYVAVKTKDEAGNASKISNIVSGATLFDSSPPTTIFDLDSTDITGYSVTLSWTAPLDIGGKVINYDIRYSLSPITEQNWGGAVKFREEILPRVGGSSETLTIFNLNFDTTYFFAIKAIDKASNYSSISNILKFTTNILPDTRPPGVIKDLSVSDVTDNSALFFWHATGNDGNAGFSASYDMRYFTQILTEENWNNATPILGLPKPSKSGLEETMTVVALKPGILYYFGIKAIDSSFNVSKISNVVSFKTSPPDIISPAAIVDLVVSSTTGYSVTLNWTATGDDDKVGLAAVYDMRYGREYIQEEFWTTMQQVVGEPSPQSVGLRESLTIFDLKASTTYYFAFRVIDDGGNQSGLSNIVKVTTTNSLDTIPPAQINDLKVKYVSGSIAALSWTAPGNDGLSGSALNYDLRFSTSGISAVNWDSRLRIEVPSRPQIAGSLESAIVTNLISGTKYYFAIKAEDALNESLISNVITIEIKEGLSGVGGITKSGSKSQLSIITSKLSFGSRGDEVKILQSILARDLDVYPEGSVTGYFGQLTRSAVRRFQAKYNIVSSGDEPSTGFGFVGPKTRIRLNEVAASDKIAFKKEELVSVSKIVTESKPKEEKHIILVEAKGFNPEILRIPLGATVEWINKDLKVAWVASDFHPTHTIYPEFDQKRGMAQGESYSLTFTRKGSWGYHDHIFSSRVGHIIVE